MKIAIDGPAGAGKSSLAKFVARKLDIAYLDTGSMYRALAFNAKENDIDFLNETQIINLLKRTKIEVIQKEKQQYIYIDGKDVSIDVRTSEMAFGASKVSSFQKVREAMVEMQQEFAKNKSVVMDGRDIGSVVLPDADFKFYVTATAKARAQRRIGEFYRRGQKDVKLEDIIEEIQKRDFDDKTRKFSPLIVAKDAQIIDTTMMNLEESGNMILKIINSKK